MTTDILGAARHVIGSQYVESVKPYILELTGLTTAAGPHDITSKDIRSDRVMIRVDAGGTIDGLHIS
ncbi:MULTISPECIES: hypothetical protein [Pseudomonas]|uniref:Peptidase inhibitor I78 family protein n=1 Tax=Pseudomonas putida TaxID=303 RepID=A0A379KGZ1_PSEPU|nr:MULTISPECIES: hypothetical protein [Pseudomonas]MBG6125340.1 hypothetical protein [Pseudomonas sp. M2]MBM7398686.1 hypothetical protein [Pseudomonas sp. M5]NSX18717.1 hypothetical protein [Pseudomonas putida]SUD66784.1 Uncharacterised protein [Pseudomonas putida]GLH33555.1 hypothetical protein BR1R5_29430 [Pseudomonas sp. BR1R-5]